MTFTFTHSPVGSDHSFVSFGAGHGESAWEGAWIRNVDTDVWIPFEREANSFNIQVD